MPLLAVDKAVTVEPIGEFTLKGIRHPHDDVQRPGALVFQTELMSAYGTKQTSQLTQPNVRFRG